MLNTASIGKGTHCTLWEQWTPAFGGLPAVGKHDKTKT